MWSPSPRDTPTWKLEAALKCRSCRTPRYSPPVHMIRLTREREIVPYVWMHPDGSANRLARRAYVRGRATQQQAACLATDYFRTQSPTVGDDGHFGPSAAPPLGQKTDTSASLDSQLAGESPCTTRMAPVDGSPLAATAAGPGGPAGPAGPAVPAGPTAPTSPLSPFSPCGPCGP
jgi:hypothetical protein